MLEHFKQAAQENSNIAENEKHCIPQGSFINLFLIRKTIIHHIQPHCTKNTVNETILGFRLGKPWLNNRVNNMLSIFKYFSCVNAI